ncbi:C-terminal helicase domain-containing protein, partial [Priestia megaterium]|uniref:C-terminal helicase domain-containing protein n=1 Tax=Priestia megaterium TaxID=1404 RepID=UPI002FFFE144
LAFPNLSSPEKIVYTYNNHIEKVFNETIKVIQRLDYARYKPLTYLKEIDKQLATMMVSQRNMSGFMKSILIKRLESSFEAFKKTLRRFINSYMKFIDMCRGGKVFISKRINIYDLLDSGDDDRLMELVEDDIVQYYPIEAFQEGFISSLQRDLMLLRNLEDEWELIIEDPKKDQFLYELKHNEILRNKKIIVFTESKETAEYIGTYLENYCPGEVAIYNGQGSRSMRAEIEANFNPNFTGIKKDNIKYLITTDVLAEGINLHRSNVLINYDLPWNPTKVMQRVGRINRVGTEHKSIHVFNFFPTAQANEHLPLEENIVSKIQAFHDTLGEDFKYLSEDEEVTSHNLYHNLNSMECLEASKEEEESELTYLGQIRDIRDNNIDLFKKIKKLPQKSKSSHVYKTLKNDCTLTFLRKGMLKKFFITGKEETRELTFLEAVRFLKAFPETKKEEIADKYYNYLQSNKEHFNLCFMEEDTLVVSKNSRTSNDSKVIKLIKAISKFQVFTEKEEQNIKSLLVLWEEGHIPVNITKQIIKLTKKMNDPLKIYHEVISVVPSRYLTLKNQQKNYDIKQEQTRIILSSYLRKEEHN